MVSPPSHSEKIQAFQQQALQILKSHQVLQDEAERLAYGTDNSRLIALPDLVLLPDNANQIQQLVLAARKFKIPIITRGRGTGTTGAAVPVYGGVILSTEHLNQIGTIEARNRLISVEAGVTNLALQESIAKHGFFWPPDPSSAAFCSVGGNIACNAAGPRAVKYGATRENVLGLTLVTGTGALIHTGTYTTKSAVGLDLTRLIIGSEGTLAIVIEATLKLTPLAKHKVCTRIFYAQIEAAAEAISALMSQPITPSALEFMDHHALVLVKNQGQKDIPAQARALLMVELEGSQQSLEEELSQIEAVIAQTNPISSHSARDPQEIKALWATRKALSPALRQLAPRKINEDIVVPVASLAELIRGLDQIASQHKIMIVSFGHGGNGNIHVNLMLNETQLEAGARALKQVFELTLELRGSLSGEHGIGEVKKNYIRDEIEPEALALMKGIKHQFDPDNILNPGKSLPD